MGLALNPLYERRYNETSSSVRRPEIFSIQPPLCVSNTHRELFSTYPEGYLVMMAISMRLLIHNQPLNQLAVRCSHSELQTFSDWSCVSHEEKSPMRTTRC